MKKIGVLLSLAVGFGISFPFPKDGRAQFYQDGTTPQQGIDFASPFIGISAQFILLVPGVGTGVRHTSAAFLNNYTAVTAAHNITDLLQYNPTLLIRDGFNYFTDLGTEVPVVAVIFHPSVDLAFLQFAYPFPHSHSHTDVLHTGIQIASAVVGQRLLQAGYGGFGTPSLGVLPRDGYLRAFDANVSSIQIDLPNYQQTNFGYESAGTLLNGRGTSGSSGGAVIDTEGNLIGVMVYAYIYNDPSGDTEHVNLSEPTIQNWINQNSAGLEPSFVARQCRENRLHQMKKPSVLLPKYPFIYQGEDVPHQEDNAIYRGDALVYQGGDGTITCIFCDSLDD